MFVGGVSEEEGVGGAGLSPPRESRGKPLAEGAGQRRLAGAGERQDAAERAFVGVEIEEQAAAVLRPAGGMGGADRVVEDGADGAEQEGAASHRGRGCGRGAPAMAVAGGGSSRVAGCKVFGD